MTIYREKLWPAPWLFVATALVVPASLLVFLPINQVAGIIVAIVLYLGSVGLLLLASPVIVVTQTELVAGKARVPVGLIGECTAHRRDEARSERGPKLDARAWLLIRGWIDPVVKVELTDPADPTPYWLLSTRRPEAVIAALAETSSRGN
jgi:hypothetical protein